MRHSLICCLFYSVLLVHTVIASGEIKLLAADAKEFVDVTRNDSTITTQQWFGNYAVVVAPRSIRSQSEYSLSVSLFNTLLPIRFRVRIIEREEETSNKTTLYYLPNDNTVVHDPHDYISTFGPTDVVTHLETENRIDGYSVDDRPETRITFVQQKSITVNPGASEMVRFMFDKDILPGSYQLEVESLNPNFPFMERKFLYVESKTFSVFIQTNKIIYKPGDVVKFRVMILDSETKPVKIENGLKISIWDASQNVIQQIQGQSVFKGIYRGEFELSKDEKFGVWNIEAEFKNKKYQKTIEVAGFTTPNFQVKVSTPTFIARSTKQFSIVVDAKYVFGKPLKGTMTLKITPVFQTKNSWSKVSKPHIIISDINGRYVADVRNHDLIIPPNHTHNAILVETLIEERTSAIIGKGKDKMIVVESEKNRTKFDIHITNFKFLLPGAHFFTTIHVKSKNGQPIPLKNSFVKFQAKFELMDKSENITMQTFKLDANGKVDVKIDVPILPTRSLKLDVRYLFAHEEVFIKAKPLHVQVATVKPKLNQVVRFQIGSMKKISSLSYYVVGRGNVLLSKTVPVEKKNVLVLEFESVFAMLPQCTLVVYYVADDGTIVSDQTEVLFSQELMLNSISLSVSKNKLRPKHELTIKVKKDKDSHLGLTLIDQSTLIMRQGGDVTKKQILNDLQKYDNAGDVDFDIPFTDSSVNLMQAGVLILTNTVAFKGKFNVSGVLKAKRNVAPLSYTSDIVSDFIIPIMPSCNVEELDNATLKEFKNTENVRKNFPDVLLWEDFSDGENSTTIKTLLPDTMTSWALTGYSLSSELGMGVTKAPLILTVFKPFFIEVNLPYSAIRGDAIIMVVSIHNYFNQKMRVEISIDKKNDEYEIIPDGRNLPDYGSYEDNDYEQKNEEQNIIYVPAEDVKAMLYRIKTKRVGQIPIIVRATSEMACDAVQKYLLVKPEGITVTRSQTKSSVTTTASKVQTSRFNIVVPANAIPDSVKVQLTVQGDKYSLDLQNLENNLKAPSGNGVSFALDWRTYAVNAKYVAATKPFIYGLQETVLGNLEKGLINLKQHECDNGGYTTSGDCEESHRDTWFTAYNLATIASMIPYKLPIDLKSLYNTLNYLVSIQLVDGSFPEKSWELSSHTFQTGPKLTSYVLIAFLTTNQYLPSVKTKYSDSIEKAANHLLKKIEKLDLFSLATLYYCLQLLNHKRRTEVYELLTLKSSTNSVSKRWHHDNSDVQTEADDLQNLMNAVLFNSDHIDILHVANGLTKSLIEKYDSTSIQSRSKVISALADFATVFSTQNPNLTVSFAPSGAPIEFVYLNKNNRFLLNQYEFHPKIRNIDFTAVGQGFVNLELKYQYNLREEDITKRFTLSVKVVPVDFEGWRLDVCTSYQAVNQNASQSNNAVMEINIPAGFKTTDFVQNTDFMTATIVKKELRGNDLRITFEKLTHKAACFSVPLYRKTFVGQALIGSVLIYDLEKPSHRTQKTFTMPPFDASLLV